MKRRELLRVTAAAGLSAGALGIYSRAMAADTIKVGMLIDTSGPLEVFGQNKLRCLELAIDEVNQGGGLLGKELELVHRDTQSNNQLYNQYARELTLGERVDVVFGATTSASREIARPIINRSDVPYFYNTNYEGGVCQRGTFCTSTTPAQMVKPMLPGLINKYGKKIYVLAADYNYGHFSDRWTRKIAKEHGGEVIGTEFFPLDSNAFSTTISKIQQVKPDIIHTVFVGPAHAAFWGQWASAGMVGQIPVTSQTFSLVGEQLLLPPEVSEGIYTCLNYFEEIANAANTGFLKRFRAKFGEKYGYVGETAMAEYQGLMLWAQAVRQAESTALDALNEATKNGITISSPSGEVTLDPATNHCKLDLYLGRVQNGAIRIVETFSAVKPENPGDQCDLVKNPDSDRQFEPEI